MKFCWINKANGNQRIAHAFDIKLLNFRHQVAKQFNKSSYISNKESNVSICLYSIRLLSSVRQSPIQTSATKTSPLRYTATLFYRSKTSSFVAHNKFPLECVPSIVAPVTYGVPQGTYSARSCFWPTITCQNACHQRAVSLRKTLLDLFYCTWVYQDTTRRQRSS